jgi:hypothetical protein
MRVFHFGGTEQCATVEELDSILSKRYGSSSNEYWLHPDASEYPCLSIMMKENYAYTQFFPAEGSAGASSIGSDTGLESGETTVFNTNTIDEEMEIANDSVIPASLANHAAKEFFRTLSLPECIEWFEL